MRLSPERASSVALKRSVSAPRSGALPAMLSYLLFIATIGGIYGLLALSLNLIWGGAGMVNLGLAGFFAVGAYASALLTTVGHAPIAAGWLLALVGGRRRPGWSSRSRPRACARTISPSSRWALPRSCGWSPPTRSG